MNHEYVRLEKRILNGEYLSKLVNENNIFTVLEIKSRHTHSHEERLKVIELLDKENNKVSLEVRINALTKFFGETLNNYMFKINKYEELELNINSNIVKWIINHNITRYGLGRVLESLSPYININSDELLNFLIEINEDILKWHYENLNHVIMPPSISFCPQPLDGKLKSIINRYEDYMLNM